MVRMKLIGANRIILTTMTMMRQRFMRFSQSTSHFDTPSGLDLQFITNLDHALQVFDHMSQRKSLFQVSDFNKLLNHMTKMRESKMSILLFKKMLDRGIPSDLITTNIIMKCYCQLGSTREGLSMIGYCFKNGLEPNLISYSTLVNGFIQQHCVLEAGKLLKKVFTYGICEPDVVMYNTIIKVLCKYHYDEKAYFAIKEMITKGLKPDVYTFNTLVASLCKFNRRDMALRLFEWMESDVSIDPPDIVTYNILINSFIIEGEWSQVFSVIMHLKETKIPFNERTYFVLINGFLNLVSVANAEIILGIAIRNGYQVDVYTLKTLMGAYCKCGYVGKALSVFHGMKTHDVVCYNILIDGYFKSLKSQEGKRLFKELISNGFEPTIVTYNTVIRGLYHVSDPRAANGVFIRMENHQNPWPDEATYRIVIKGLCENRQLNMALRVFVYLDAESPVFDLQVYTILIDEAGKSGHFRVWLIVLGKMLVKGVKPDRKTLNVVISAMTRNGMTMEAYKLFSKLEAMGYPPDSVSYNLMAQGIIQGIIQQKVPMRILHGLMVDVTIKGFKFDESTLGMMLQHLELLKQDKAGFTVVKMVLRNGKATKLDNALYYVINLTHFINFFHPCFVSLYVQIVSSFSLLDF